MNPAEPPLGLEAPQGSCGTRVSLRVPPLAPSAWLLVGANAIALLGVLVLGWRLGDIMLLYWVESAVIGLYTVLKMIAKRHWGALFLVPFFCFHYGMFMSVHLVFLAAFFFDGGVFTVGEGLFATLVRVSPAILALLASHGVSFWTNFLRGGERQRLSLNDLMGSPYPRIIVMHLTIILGGMLAAAWGSPVYALVMLLALKTGVDLAAHRREHRRAQAAAGPMGS